MSFVDADIRFAIVPEWLIDHPKATERAIQLFAVLARLIDYDTKETTESRRTLARRCRCSLDTIDRAAALLKDIGALSWEQTKHADGSLGPSLFRLHYTAPVRHPDRKNADTPPRKDADTSSDIDTQKGTPNGVPARAATMRKPDLLFEAICTVSGKDHQQLTRTEHSILSKVTAELKAVGATPDEVVRRAFRWHAKFADAQLTETALLKHWGRLVPPQEPKPRSCPPHRFIDTDPERGRYCVLCKGWLP